MKWLIVVLMLWGSFCYAQFQIGDNVEVSQRAQDCINARSAPQIPSTVLKCEPIGATGKVVDGPTTASGYTWYRIAYMDGITGWSNGAVFDKIEGGGSPPIPGACNYDSAKATVHRPDSTKGYALGFAAGKASVICPPGGLSDAQIKKITDQFIIAKEDSATKAELVRLLKGE